MNRPNPTSLDPALRERLDRIVEGTAEPEDFAAVERLAGADPAVLRRVTAVLHQHASLTWWARMGTQEPAQIAESQDVAESSGPAGKTARRTAWYGWATAAVLLVGVGLLLSRPQEPRTFAVLLETRHCRWENALWPTAPGARWGAGEMQLAEGVAKLRFDNQAELTIEGPARLLLLTGDRCRLLGGRVMGKIPPQAIGFTVDTPTAEVKDLGTEFGVVVGADGTAGVQVFTGEVDVKHLAGGDQHLLQAGRNVRFHRERVEEVETFDSPGEDLRGERESPAESVRLSTAFGRGKDSYIQFRFPTENVSSTLMLIKNSKDVKRDFLRKGYFAIDLEPLRGKALVDAHLLLSFEPTGMGYGSELPDATFTVYGLLDESGDDWSESSIRWADAPANLPGGAEVDPEKTVPLGTFVIPQGLGRGTVTIDGVVLRQFLEQDTNGLATFVLVRNTTGSGRNDLVHGFVGKEHPSGMPPTLKLLVCDRE